MKEKQIRKEVKQREKQQRKIEIKQRKEKIKLDKVRKSAEIIQNTAKRLPSFNEKVEDVLEIKDIKYGEYSENTLDIYYKDKIKHDAIVIFIHGGGWVSYDKDFYTVPLKKIANMNTVVFNCNYRLAPEYGIEDMEKDILKIFDYVKEEYKKYNVKKKIVLIGDSAGAHLVSLFANKIFLNKYQDNHYKKYIKGLILFYGVYNIYEAKYTKFNNVDTFINSIINIDSSREEMDKISPVYYLSNKIPKTLILSGEIDKLHSESLSYYNVLKNYNIDVDKLFISKKIPSARHSFLNMGRSIACKLALEKVSEFLNNL